MYSRTQYINGERPAAQPGKGTAQSHHDHVHLKVVETTMGRKEQRERARKKAAKGSYALSGFAIGFLPKKRSWSDGDLNATATS